MPVNRKTMMNMKKEYGLKKGENVYYAVEMQRKRSRKRRESRANGGGNVWTDTERHTKRRD